MHMRMHEINDVPGQMPQERTRTWWRKPRGKARWTGLIRTAGIATTALALAMGFGLLILRGPVLNGYVQTRAHRAFAEAHPGYDLRVGPLRYDFRANRLTAQWLAIESGHLTFTSGPVSIWGVRWMRLLHTKSARVEALSNARLDATNLVLQFPRARYGLYCEQLQASAPRSQLSLRETELRPLVTDEEFFNAHRYRVTRYRVRAPSCEISGLRYRELLNGAGYGAGAIHFSRPTFDALVSKEKPPDPFRLRPLMLHEALAVIPVPVQIDSISLTKGHVTYRERSSAGAQPGVLTFGAINLAVEGIANHPDRSAAISLRGEGDLMEAATLQLRMSVPVSPATFSLRYWGSLQPMDLTRLNAFLESANHLRIKSGKAEGIDYVVEVANGDAQGRIQAIYRDLEVVFLNQNEAAEGVRARVESFVAKEFRIRRDNSPDLTPSMKDGKIDYQKKPQDEFTKFIWLALRSGILDIISK